LRHSGGMGGLFTISDAVLLEPFGALKASLSGLGALFEFLGLMQYVCRDNSGDADLFARVLRLLRIMNGRPELVATFAPRSRLLALQHLGRMPDWESCSACSADAPRVLAAGGVYCPSCHAAQGGPGREVTGGALGALATLAAGDEPGPAAPWGEMDAVLAWLLDRSEMMHA